MIDRNEWVPFESIEWDDPKYNVFSVDTRDFFMGYRWEDKLPKNFDIPKFIKAGNFFHTEQEVKDLISRLYEESGGKGEWRWLELDCNLGQVLNWNMKYIRVWRTEHGFIVCNKDNYALSKATLRHKVNTDPDILNYH